MILSEKDIQRLWSKLNKAGPVPAHCPDLGSCWEWTGCANRRGYGKVQIQGRTMIAHRMIWLAHHGNLPATLSVLHKCDNPPCCNPDHLFLGTTLDNAADMVAKNRQVRGPDVYKNRRTARGSKAGRAKLTEEQVREIRSLAGTCFEYELAARYAVTQAQIHTILAGKAWKHVDPTPQYEPAGKGEGHPHAKLTWDQVREIRSLVGTCEQQELAKRFGVSKATICLIVSGKHWRE